MNEEAVNFGADGSLVGIVTKTTHSAAVGRPAFVFLNSGLTPRMGPHRLHVTMARALAAQGFTAFRIDLSGIGDSPPRGGRVSILDRWTAETREAMDYLATTHAAERFVLVGNCSGAAVAFAAASVDPRVCGTALINLQGPVPYLRYYLKLLTKRASWLRLLRGTMRYREVVASLGAHLRRVFDKGKATSEEILDIEAVLDALGRHRTRMLLVFSYWDPSLDFYRSRFQRMLAKAVRKEDVQTLVVPGMNHDFSLLHGQQRLRAALHDWAKTFAVSHPRDATAGELTRQPS